MTGASRYQTIVRLAAGGMATVWIGTVHGALGFRQLVAIKKPHPHLLLNPGFRDELVAEARLASMIRHANVVDVRDVEIDGESISLVMDYIEGASLGELIVAASRCGEGSRLPARVAVRILRDTCAGLHAAHELVDERDRPVGLVHRDVSPQNVLVGTDGISRVTDFGVAKFARKHMQSTSEGSLKGKLAYMAPEYVLGEKIDRRCDVFATGIVLWEALTGKRCFRGDNDGETVRRLLEVVPDPVSKVAPELEPLDAVIACALAKDPAERFQNAAAMGAALEAAAAAAGLLGGYSEVADTVKELVGTGIEERRTLVRQKLADEPSIASLMGVEGVLGPVSTAASTQPEETVRVPAGEVTQTTVVQTLPAPVVVPARPLGGMLRSEDRASPVPPVGPALSDPPPPRRSGLPLVLGVGLTVIVASGVAFALGPSLLRATGTQAGATASTAGASSTSPLPSVAASAASSESASASAAQSASASPASSQSAVAPAARALSGKKLHAPRPSASPTPSTTIKRPPANPYE